ncbi:MAG: FolC bifunctional protein, partial [Candidatus Uhrbacteria bacterium GW2011_GWC2_53_7]
MLDWLYSLKTIGIMPGLEKISEAMEKLGNPQDKLRIIHVAGTNGKGSVCAMLESILRHAGYKVGMFTSPHLVDFEERFQVNREKISREDAFRLVSRVRESGVNLTFFELTTAVAFLHFLEKKVDYVVLEVGMGGRLDATNIVKPVATVITSISFDHTNWLGDTL